MNSTMQKTPKSTRGRLPRELRLPAVLAAVVVGLLILRAVLAALTPAPGTAEAPPEDVPDAPEWVERQLLPVNEYSRPGEKLTAVNGVVVHYTGNPGTTAEQNRSYFAGLAQSGETYASSNFVIGLEGEILECVPLDEVAYASSQRNYDTLSIEVCHPDDTGEFTQASYDALVKLVQWLVDTYGLERDQILRHYDVTGKECPRYYVQHPEAWEVFLDDLTF
ncbi:N-acetylmuramoyl-L-alanine amidase family protein [Pseudoflavonifractor capillosus]|uniref:N-acetylmuramoyl-L-alanine amidase n=1 Tax=Pseudoflavonifractor capillosus TaxID=106588 RepID=A0A921SSI9_9FIRM|nr:peptidoglycan recognition family protein [Pseudoflavonifractor capillosus]HJG86900.1 peptidoglycan recognition protein family protein [Pseudoflavonifractor capillosus]